MAKAIVQHVDSNNQLAWREAEVPDELIVDDVYVGEPIQVDVMPQEETNGNSE